PEVRDLVVPEVDPVEGDRSFGRVEEPHEQVREGRLSGPGGADHTDARARREFERHMTQDETIFVVAEGDVLERDVARGPDERPTRSPCNGSGIARFPAPPGRRPSRPATRSTTPGRRTSPRSPTFSPSSRRRASVADRRASEGT